MDEQESLAARFEGHRSRLRTIAFRILGSIPDADDAVQATWLRLSRADAARIEDLEGWLVTVVARVCLDGLRSRRARREDAYPAHIPEPVVSRLEGDPEQAALLGEALGSALFVVIDALSPAERLAFVLHDVFAVPFEEIARIMDRTPAATRQLASRARRRVRGAPVPDADLGRQRVVVDAFFRAAREGDFEALLAVLDPDVIVRADFGALSSLTREVRGALSVAEQTLAFAQFPAFGKPALVNGAYGIVAAQAGRRSSVIGFVVRNGRVAEIDIFADPDRLERLDLAGLDG